MSFLCSLLLVRGYFGKITAFVKGGFAPTPVIFDFIRTLGVFIYF